MLVKTVLSFKIDPNTWLMVNAIQLVRSFALINSTMPNTLRTFLLNGILSCNIEIPTELLQKF